MKKPNITFDTENTVYINPRYSQSITGEDLAEVIEEMIDALIWCYDFIQELKDHGIDNWSKEDEVLKALKKAGCTDE